MPVKKTGLKKLLGKPLLDIRKRWKSDCWVVATIEVHGVLREITRDDRRGGLIVDRWPDQCAWFCWEPKSKGVPYAPPTGWGMSVGSPFDDLCEALDGKRVFMLDERAVEWSNLLDLMLIDFDEPNLTQKALITLIAQKRAERQAWAKRYYAP